MGFSREIKNELNMITDISDCCMLAEISGIVHTSGSLIINLGCIGLEIVTQSDMSAFLDAAINKLYGKSVLKHWENNSLGGNNIYNIPPEIAKSVLTDCGIIRYDEHGNTEIIEGVDSYLVQEDCCRAAFIRGAFLGGGSITGLDGASGLHMEFVMNSERLAHDLSGLFTVYGIKTGLIERRGKFIIYVKGGDGISDILALTGATHAVLKLNEYIVIKEVKNRINRGNNCFSANTGKMIGAELRQLEAIEYIISEKGIEFLSGKLKAVAEYRIGNNNKSYDEMARDLNIPKSTVSRSLNKITYIADTLRREKDV